jgi:hypothetical protein
MITEAEAEGLYSPVSLEELRDILKNFKIDKSPGPDGLDCGILCTFLRSCRGGSSKYGRRVETERKNYLEV